MEIVKDEKELFSQLTAEVDKQKKPKKVAYDPNKQYTWKPDAVFTLNGEEFGSVLNAIRSILATREAQTILWADRANDYIEEIFKRQVENGIVVPQENAQGK